MYKKCLFGAVGFAFVVLLIAFVVISMQYTSYTFAQLQSCELQTLSNERIEITGYMSPLLSPTRNYFYLVQTPYNTDLQLSKENNRVRVSLPVYPSIPNGIEYTDTLIKVKGVLSVAEYKDNNGYYNSYRLLEAEYALCEQEEYDTYNILASADVYQDVWMYYSLLQEIIRGNVSVAELVEIDEAKFEDMLLYLAINKFGADNITSIIDEELGLVRQVNQKIQNKEYEFEELQDEVIQLEEHMKTYFQQWSVE